MCPALKSKDCSRWNLAHNKFSPFNSGHMSNVQGCPVSTDTKTGLSLPLSSKNREVNTCRIRIKCYPTSAKNGFGEALGFLSTEQI